MPRRHHHYGKLAAAISATLYATTGLVTAVSYAHAQEAAAPTEEEVAPAATAASDPSVDVVTVMGDPLRALGGGPSESAMGFAWSGPTLSSVMTTAWVHFRRWLIKFAS